MKKALLRRKRRKPDRIKKKIEPVILSKKESEKRGKYARSKVKQELISIIHEEESL
jgi:hypothetical protein